MKTKIALCGLAALALLVGVAGAEGPNGARPGSVLGGPAPLPDTVIGTPDLTEGFDDITVLPGWFLQNNSQPLGVTNWFQGNSGVFPAQAGAATSYIGANYNNTTGSTGTISNWLLTPEISLPIEDACFWTRTATGSIWPDRLEVRVSTNGASTNVGTLATDTGDFSLLVLSVNPTLAAGGYPETWTQFCTGAVAGSGTGRIGFRYYVTGAGPSGTNSNYIGIDSFEYTAGPTYVPPTIQAIPTLGRWGLAALTLLLVGAAFLLVRRR